MAIWTKTLTALGALGLLAGCASTKEDILPQDGPTMKQIYDQHMHASAAAAGATPRASIARPLSPSREDLAAYTREAATEIEQQFPLLPNPQMVLYVYPHLSREGAPVPGYSTAFPMYRVDQYALPGEVYRP